jgi:hypothetical protein
MSQLGDLVRLSPALRAEITSDLRTAYDRMTGEFEAPQRLELDWEWGPFTGLMELAGWPVNPFTGGSPFPGADDQWDDAYTVDAAQVADVAARLRDTPFAALAPHLRTVFSGTGGREYVRSRPLHPTDDWLREKHGQLAGRYAELVEFYRVAAANSECTVFWAA